MFGKKQLILLLAVAVGSFGVAFLVTYLIGGKAVAPPQPVGQVGSAAVTLQGGVMPQKARLDDLIKQLQYEIAEYRRKKRQLNEWEHQLRIARQDLEQQVRELEDLRVQLVAPLNSLKEALGELRMSRIQVGKEERDNLKRVAAVYDKMDSSASSKIFGEMCKSNRMDDAVKLLNYMSERPVAKLLAEMPDKALVAKLSEKLGKIREEG